MATVAATITMIQSGGASPLVLNQPIAAQAPAKTHPISDFAIGTSFNRLVAYVGSRFSADVFGPARGAVAPQTSTNFLWGGVSAI